MIHLWNENNLLHSALSLGIESKCFFLNTLKVVFILEDKFFPAFKKGQLILACSHQSSQVNRSCWFCGICSKAIENVGFCQQIELLFEVMEVDYRCFWKDIYSRCCWSNRSISPFHRFLLLSSYWVDVTECEKNKCHLWNITGTSTDCCKKVYTVHHM